MAEPIRVLVAEDSEAARELIVAILESEPGIQVIGTCATGSEAVRATASLRPHLITMDIQMPELDGLEATRRIMMATPTPVLIVSSAANTRAIEVSLDALRVGALAAVAKPEGPLSPDFETHRTQLIRTVRALADTRVIRMRSTSPPPAAPTAPVRRTPPAAIAIAASTGGPAVIQALLAALPRTFPAPLLIVQHIAPGFVQTFVRWLGHTAGVTVKLAEQGEPLRAGHAYIAPEHAHLAVSPDLRARLDMSPPLDGFRPSASVLFESVATLGARGAGIILTGMGRDGVAGLQKLRSAGGLVLAQDEATSVVYGMPGEAERAGVVDLSLRPEQMPTYLKSLYR